MIQTSKVFRPRRHGLIGIALVCMALPCGCGSMFSPLRVGQEAQTGGRATLSMWEVYDALSQMYQAQVMMNMIRLVEYGETPLHFEFSSITPNITDTGMVSSTFKFVDSPTGKLIGGGLVGAGAQLDTNVTFTPMVSGTRVVNITAKAEPIVRENWVYNWYYTMAEIYDKRPERRFYMSAKPWEAAVAAVEGRLVMQYRGKAYMVKPDTEKLFPTKDKQSPRVSGLVAERTAQRELGGLTAIVSFLGKSDPMSVSRALLRINMMLVDGPSKDGKLSLSVVQEGLSKKERDELDKIGKLLEEKKARVWISFPVKPGNPYFEVDLQIVSAGGHEDWKLAIVDPDVHDVPAALKEVAKDQEELEKAAGQFLDLNEKRDGKLYVSLAIPYRARLFELSAYDAACSIAGFEELVVPKNDTDILKEISRALKEIESLERIQSTRP